MLIISSATHAKWTKIPGEFGVFDGVYYVDFKTVKKQHGLVYFWLLEDESKISSIFTKKDPEISIKKYFKSDCTRFEMKMLRQLFYKTRMGKGAPSRTYKFSDEPRVQPGRHTAYEAVLKAVCSHRF